MTEHLVTDEEAARCMHKNLKWSNVIIDTAPETETWRCLDCGTVGHKSGDRVWTECFCLPKTRAPVEEKK